MNDALRIKDRKFCQVVFISDINLVLLVISRFTFNSHSVISINLQEK